MFYVYEFPSMLCENIYIAKRNINLSNKHFPILKTVCQTAVQSRIKYTFSVRCTFHCVHFMVEVMMNEEFDQKKRLNAFGGFAFHIVHWYFRGGSEELSYMKKIALSPFYHKNIFDRK